MIKELCDKRGVTCVYTSKLFFNDFHSSITIPFPLESRKVYEDEQSNIRHRFFPTKGYYRTREAMDDMHVALVKSDRAFNEVRMEFINKIFDNFEVEDRGFRMNKVSVTFYTNNIEVIADMLSRYKGDITRTTVPRNEAEIAFMRTNTDKRIGEKYWIDKYPYRIVFQRQTSLKNEYLSKYITENLGLDPKPNGDIEIDPERAHYYCRNTSHILYLKDFQDLFLTKIGVSEIIDRIEETVLTTTVSKEV